MFCPKCGTQNSDTNKFCRACSENLLAVAQAMKKNLPVLIASKIDAALEKVSERFRRDAFLWLFVSVVMTISTVYQFSSSSRYTVELFLALIGFLASGWSYLTYKRSLELGEKLEAGKLFAGFPIHPTALINGIQTPDLAASSPEYQLKERFQLFFCPSCGTKEKNSLHHCGSCGADLHALRKAIEPSQWERWLNSKLDPHIARVSDKSLISRNVKVMWGLGGFYLLMGLVDFLQGRPSIMLVPGITCLLVGLWDRAASRRWFPKENQNLGQTDALINADVSVPTTNELALPTASILPSINATEETTRRLEPVVAQTQKISTSR